MARPRKYTPQALRRAVSRYFRSITRTQTVTEPVATGVKDGDGHMIYEQRPVLNDLGEEITYKRYLLPPSITDLCLFLGIHPSTWSEWSKHDTHPEYEDATEYARQTILAWNKRELLTREGKDVRGIIFNLTANFGMREGHEIEVGRETAQLLLQMSPEAEEYGA